MHVIEIANYLKKGVKELVEQGQFDNGMPFRPTQKEALEEFNKRLHDPTLLYADAITGFFDIPGGIGKTAMFVSIITKAYEAAQRDYKDMSLAIVVPTTRIMSQTKDAFDKFAPQMQRRIGFYGDRKFNLKRPVKIIMDVKWAELTKEGKIGPHNINALFVDEAHSETSEFRRDEIYKYYDGKTALIGFTATPNYDEEKSVLQTHRNCIYSKKLPEAVLGGELAAYIQAYAYEIRVEPPTEEHLNALFNDEAIKSGWYKRKLKQTAWSNTVLRIYKEGTDKLTGQLLSDNPAAFFTDDTDHAKALAAMLNADPVLQQRAAARGCEKVAKAIHTVGMGRKAQRQAFKDFEQGRIMAIVGDEKFKEGFDHPPLKTIFDYQHGSLVDKLQILMRGGRQYEDKGLTFIDPIIYVGSNDPRLDAQARRAAIRQAFTAYDILGGSYILGPHAPARNGKLYPKTNYIFEDDGNIKEYVSEEEYSLLMSERAALQRGEYIEFTNEMREELKKYIDKTGVGPERLLTMNKDTKPEGLNPNSISNCLFGRANLIIKEAWPWVLEAYEQCQLIKITDKMHEKLISYKEKKGIGATNLIKMNKGFVPEGLSDNNIQNYIEGSVTTVIKDHWDWIMKAYHQCPNRLRYTAKMNAKLEMLRARTGISGHKIIKQNHHNIPDGMTLSIIDRLFCVNPLEREVTVREDHWQWLIKSYRNCPYIALDKNRKKFLQNQKERTQVGADGLLKIEKIRNHEDITEGILNYIISSGFLEADHPKAKRAMHKDLWIAIKNHYENLPSILPYTEEMHTVLRTYINKTGVGAEKLLTRNKKDVPDGFSTGIAKSYTQISNKRDTVREDYYNWMVSKYAILLKSGKTLQPHKKPNNDNNRDLPGGDLSL